MHRASNFPGVHLTAGQLRDLIGDQTTDLAELKLRSLRGLPDHQHVAIAAGEVQALGGVIGYGTLRLDASPAGRPIAVTQLIERPVRLKVAALRMLLANSPLQLCDVLSEYLQPLPADREVAIETDLHEQLVASAHKRKKKAT